MWVEAALHVKVRVPYKLRAVFATCHPPSSHLTPHTSHRRRKRQGAKDQESVHSRAT